MNYAGKILLKFSGECIASKVDRYGYGQKLRRISAQSPICSLVQAPISLLKQKWAWWVSNKSNL